MPGSLIIVYRFPKTTTVIVVLQSSAALNDCPDWVGQPLVEAIFNHAGKTAYVLLASQCAKELLAPVPSINLKLDPELSSDTKPTVRLEAYSGRYFNFI